MRQMPNGPWQRCEGHIQGLLLSQIAWNALQREGIMTLDQLRAVADRIERIEGIGVKIAQAIRDELARLAASEGQPPDNGQP
jgi:DNA-directed RNA polymerase alpha subunit